MTNLWMRACSSAVLALSLVAGGCTASPQAAANAAMASPEVQELLRHIPADTPYAWISMSGSTRPFVDKMAVKAAPLLKKAEEGLAAVLATNPGGDEPAARVLRAIGAELQGKLSVAGFESLGFDPDAKFAIYGIGLLPAMRMHFKDTTALRATLDRIQAASGVQFPTANHEGQVYWSGSAGKLEFVVVLTNTELVAGVVVKEAGLTRDRTLSTLLGQELPKSSLADGAVLRDIIAAHQLGQFSAGFIDVRGVVDALVGASSGFNAETAGILLAGSTPTPECAAEFRGLAGLMPRLVFGTTRLDESGLETRMVGELRPDLAAGLAAVRVRVPGLDGATAKEVMLGMGSGVDVGRALELAKAQAMVVEAAPFKCPDLKVLNEAAQAVVRGVPEVPLPVRQLRGFAFALEDANFTGFLPTGVRGYATLGTPDPLGLVKTVKGLLPGEAQFLPDLTEEGTPQRLNFAGLPIPIPDTYMAGRRDAGLAFTVGGDAEQRASTLLTQTGEATPLMVFHVNMGRMMKMLPMGANVDNSEVFSIIGSQGYVFDANAGGVVARSWINFAE